MPLFEKLGEVAKNIGDRTNDAIETTKLNNKINGEKSAAEAELKKIGAFYYEQYTNRRRTGGLGVLPSSKGTL